MSRRHPWESSNHDDAWSGYFLPGTDVLRNRVGATTRADLADAENDLVEIRVAELRADPSYVPRTYDLAHLQSLHRFLFQDVYVWAGDLRTVGIEKAGESFAPPEGILRPVAHIADDIAQTERLRGVDGDALMTKLAYMYDYINYAHPFREGNGRTQRELFDQLLSETGRGLAWNLIDKAELHDACHTARASFDLNPLRALFGRLVDGDPAYLFS